MHSLFLTEHMNYSCFTQTHRGSTSVRCLGLFCEITSSFCAWTVKGLCLPLRGLPYSISLVKSRDHGGWMLRHEGYHQLQHIMQILILQTKQNTKTMRERLTEKGAHEEGEFSFHSLLRLCKCKWWYNRKSVSCDCITCNCRIHLGSWYTLQQETVAVHCTEKSALAIKKIKSSWW